MGIKAITDDMWRANGLHMSKSNVTIALVMIVGINVSLIFSFLDENLQHLQLWNQSENSYEETREGESQRWIRVPQQKRAWPSLSHYSCWMNSNHHQPQLPCNVVHETL